MRTRDIPRRMRLVDKMLIGVPALAIGGVVITTKVGATLVLIGSLHYLFKTGLFYLIVAGIIILLLIGHQFNAGQSII